jgi:lipopolysaccharide/colanic/teichoic acid biosynthesis glycosyltransferase
MSAHYSLESNTKMTRPSAMQRRAKHWLDWIGASVLIVCFLPAFVAIALMIVLESGWPIIYRRRVISANGEFNAFKFRTMRRDADLFLETNPALKAEFERNFKLINDPRVTKVGALLRKTSLDELPQLFNVLLGQMSLVGPRMITAPELGKYGQQATLLLSVRPGLTGYWQVHGRQNVAYHERVAMDIRYIKEWSLAMDLQILVETPLRVLKRDGAF